MMNALNKGKIASRILLVLLFFFYVYPVKFSFCPIDTKILFAVLGLLTLVLNWNSKVPVWIINLLVLFASIVFISLLTILINGTKDIFFIKNIIILSIILLGAYFLKECIQRIDGKIDFETIGRYFIIAVCLQMIIAILMFLIPALKVYLLKIQNLPELTILMINTSPYFRLFGFGFSSLFFAAGIINSIALILISSLLFGNASKIYVIAFILITIIGSMMSRTTIVGAILGMILFLYGKITQRKVGIINLKKMKLFLKTISLVCLLVIITNTLVPQSVLSKFDESRKYGFELFINFFKKGKLETESTNELKQAYIFPTSFKTYIIGDGYYADPINPKSQNYMGTDVGYLRLLFYFGIFGTLMYIVVQLYPVFIGNKIDNKTHKLFFVFIFFFYLLLNLKGMVDIFAYTIIFCFIDNRQYLL